ncbi:MAG TPA: VWA domain-containing protein [bacterium]|nr:VWA domain-containing protein [bacterium]
MSLGAPAALWGLLALPFLVLLYLLRVRRRDHPVSSILLWQRSVPTLAAYRPSRRIERGLLLLLQLLAVAAIVAGLARPALVGRNVAGRDVVFVLDGSLSMRARDVSPTRFDRARGEALALVARLQLGQRAAVVLAAPHPVVLAPITDDFRAVAAALRNAEPWDAAGDVAAAVTVAAAQRPGPNGQIVVWTDAARGPLPAVSGVTYRIVGTSDDNVAITELRVLRDAPTPEALVRVDNYGSAARRVPLEVRLGETLVYRATLELQAGGSRTAVFPVAGAGVLRAHLAVRDMLPEDDDATAVLAPTPLPSVLLVGRGNPSLERVLRLLPVARAVATETVNPAAWAAFDVVILDRVDTGPLPPGNYLVIGSVPPNLPVSATGVTPQPEIATWDREDPVLRFVDLRDVRINRALTLVPEGGRVLAAGQTPLLWEYEGRGVRAVLLGFALEDSDLPAHVAFPILVRNSLAWLGGGVDGATAGDEVQIPAGSAAAATLVAPDGRRFDLHPTDGVFVLPPLVRAGLYRFSTAAGERTFAATIGGRDAGVIHPGRAPADAESAPPGSRASVVPGSVLVHVPLWPWLLTAAAAAVLGEWALATRRRGGDA